MLNLNLISALAKVDKVAVGQSFEIMWKGMLAIFIAIGLVFFSIIIMSMIFKKIKLYKEIKAAREATENTTPQQ